MKIKGLSSFHRSILKKLLIEENQNCDFEIQFNEPISLTRMQSYWYGGNVVDLIVKQRDKIPKR